MSNVVFFDGVDDRVVMVDSASLKPLSAVTIIVRFKFWIGTQGVYFRSFYNKYGGGGGYFLGNKSVTMVPYSELTGVSTSPIEGTRKMNPSTIYHLSVAYDATAGANNFRLYLDGQKIVEKTGINNIIDTTGIDATLSPAGYPANCIIYEVQVYNRQLTDSEVLYNFMRPNNPIRRGIQLNLTQDSIQGAQWLDLSGNNNHGTYVGGALPTVANLLCGR